MLTEVVMPKLGLTMMSGVIERWIKKEGDHVNKGEPLFEVTTDKATVEVEAAGSGYLKKVLAEEFVDVPVMEVIAYIGAEDDVLPGDGASAGTLAESAVAASQGDTVAVAVAPAKPARVKASPVAKRLAAEQGIDLSTVAGTGPDGIIDRDDVLAAKAALDVPAEAAVVAGAVAEAVAVVPASAPVSEKGPTSGLPAGVLSTVKLAGIKKLVAERMKASYLDAPHIRLVVACDMSEASRLRERINRINQGKAHVTHTDLLVKATAQALKKNRLLNATLQGDTILLLEEINIGIATATEKGLVVPVIRTADHLSLLEIAAARQALIERVREGRQTLDDLAGGTFTVTNLGMFGIESFGPIITPGQAGILGVGQIKMTPVADDAGCISVKPIMRLSLACDHRIADGSDGARYLADLKQLLEDPAIML